jgi:predicted secreted protein
MRTRAILICALLCILFLVPACAVKNNQVTVSCEEFRNTPNIERNIDVAVGDSLTVNLCSNPSTGFSWQEQATIEDVNVLSQKSHRFITDKTIGKDVVGAAGVEEWVFTLKKEGTTTIYMEYSRPWAGGEKAVQTFKLTVTVK